MGQFDVYANPNPATHPDVPYLLDVQSDLLEPLATRVVIPLFREGTLKPATYLNPTFEVEGHRVVASTAEIAGIPRSAIGPRVASLEDQRTRIVRAIDFLLAGV